jgi:uncharacterized protein with HEPN domain
MTYEIQKYLFDIQDCINRIENFVGSPKIFQNYVSNLMLQQAVERNFEIMGEAMNNILKINPNISITNARKIVDARNKIIHGYDSIEPENIWNIIIRHLPLLKIEVDTLLGNN